MIFENIILVLCYVVSQTASDIGTLSSLDVLDDSLYFEIVDPPSLRFTYKILISKNFGKPFQRSYRQVDLVVADPYEACTPLTDESYFYNKVVLARRGECSFQSKAVIAQRAGALAVIISDYDNMNDDTFIHMAGDRTDRNIDIPAAFLLGKDGEMITELLRQAAVPSAIINIPLNLTGMAINKINLPPWVVCNSFSSNEETLIKTSISLNYLKKLVLLPYVIADIKEYLRDTISSKLELTAEELAHPIEELVLILLVDRHLH